MKCPKCHYLGFGDGERCRHCGYDFSLAVESEPSDHLSDATFTSPSGVDAVRDRVLDRFLRTSTTPTPSRAGVPDAPLADDFRRTTPTSLDLPLFHHAVTEFDDRPLITPSPVPRPPLAVRRDAPDHPRSRRRPCPEATAPLAALLGSTDLPETEEKPATAEAASWSGVEPAGDLRRGGAILMDLLLLTGIHAVVLYLTLRVCGLGLHEVSLLPPVPMVGFLLLLSGGYFIGLTAACGQTVGKMLTGIRVVAADGAPVPIGAAVIRAAAYLVSAVPAGFGFALGLIGRERRALHDRLADTRVVGA